MKKNSGKSGPPVPPPQPPQAPPPPSLSPPANDSSPTVSLAAAIDKRRRGIRGTIQTETEQAKEDRREAVKLIMMGENQQWLEAQKTNVNEIQQALRASALQFERNVREAFVAKGNPGRDLYTKLEQESKERQSPLNKLSDELIRFLGELSSLDPEETISKDSYEHKILNFSSQLTNVNTGHAVKLAELTGKDLTEFEGPSFQKPAPAESAAPKRVRPRDPMPDDNLGLIQGPLFSRSPSHSSDSSDGIVSGTPVRPQLPSGAEVISNEIIAQSKQVFNRMGRSKRQASRPTAAQVFEQEPQEKRQVSLLKDIETILEPETSPIMKQLDALEEKRKQIPGSSRERFAFVRDMVGLRNQLEKRVVSDASEMASYENEFNRLARKVAVEIYSAEATVAPGLKSEGDMDDANIASIVAAWESWEDESDEKSVAFPISRPASEAPTDSFDAIVSTAHAVGLRLNQEILKFKPTDQGSIDQAKAVYDVTGAEVDSLRERFGILKIAGYAIEDILEPLDKARAVLSSSVLIAQDLLPLRADLKKASGLLLGSPGERELLEATNIDDRVTNYLNKGEGYFGADDDINRIKELSGFNAADDELTQLKIALKAVQERVVQDQVLGKTAGLMRGHQVTLSEMLPPDNMIPLEMLLKSEVDELSTQDKKVDSAFLGEDRHAQLDRGGLSPVGERSTAMTPPTPSRGATSPEGREATESARRRVQSQEFSAASSSSSGNNSSVIGQNIDSSGSEVDNSGQIIRGEAGMSGKGRGGGESGKNPNFSGDTAHSPGSLTPVSATQLGRRGITPASGSAAAIGSPAAPTSQQQPPPAPTQAAVTSPPLAQEQQPAQARGTEAQVLSDKDDGEAIRRSVSDPGLGGGNAGGRSRASSSTSNASTGTTSSFGASFNSASTVSVPVVTASAAASAPASTDDFMRRLLEAVYNLPKDSPKITTRPLPRHPHPAWQVQDTHLQVEFNGQANRVNFSNGTPGLDDYIKVAMALKEMGKTFDITHPDIDSNPEMKKLCVKAAAIAGLQCSLKINDVLPSRELDAFKQELVSQQLNYQPVKNAVQNVVREAKAASVAASVALDSTQQEEMDPNRPRRKP